MTDDFEPGDLVIHRHATNRDDHGIVMENMWHKEGYTPVYKQRHTWMKTENLILVTEWEKLHRPQSVRRDIKNYWIA
jgi:hypothetical protein